ncbi:MAG: recombinase family protein [Verrucomicrobia bacterium]|nr:recombinase family protein [Verrucomicrobiota bacterium]
MNTVNTELPTKSAAVYVRKSKKHRRFSISNQARAIRKYAKHRGLRIEKAYFDSAKQPIER